MATTLHFCYPAMVIVFSIVFREKVRLPQAIVRAMCLAGMFMFYDVGGNISLTGIFLAFVSGNTYAFLHIYILIRANLKKYDSQTDPLYEYRAAVLIGSVALQQDR